MRRQLVLSHGDLAECSQARGLRRRHQTWVHHAVAAITAPRQPDFTMLIGADLNGQLLEIGVLAADDNDYVIHAMRARTKYVQMIKPTRGGQP